MGGSKLEVADIFRAHGPAYRGEHAGHLNLPQLKVMSAVENCRTAALGGHVAACTKCDHQHIAYNSCRNRHCPKCQGAAAQDWMEARMEDLLPVEYFHVVFTLPSEIADIAYQNKEAVYGLLFKASAQTLQTIAADPKHLGAKIGMTSVLHTSRQRRVCNTSEARLWRDGLGNDAPPPCPCCCAGRRLVIRRSALDPLSQRVLRVGESPVTVIPPPVLRRIGQAAQGGQAGILWQSIQSGRSRGLRITPCTTAQNQLGRLRQTTLRRAGNRVGLPKPLNASGRDLEPSPD